MKLHFTEDIEKDIHNWQKNCDTTKLIGNWLSNFQPLTIEKIKDAEFLENYLNNRFYKTGMIAEFKKWLEQNVNIDEIIDDLENLTNKKFTFELINARITTFPLAGYDIKGDWGSFFYLTFFNSVDRKKTAVEAIYHELLHFIFHVYYWQLCLDKGLSAQETNDLKESVTILLNPILEKRGLPLDKGYPTHEKFRAAITGYRDMNFDSIVEKAMSLFH